MAELCCNRHIQAGRLPSRVEHRAICPAFADTAILTGLGVDRSVLERKEGISDPEWVGDCFLRLVQVRSVGSSRYDDIT